MLAKVFNYVYHLMYNKIVSLSPALFEKCVFQCRVRRCDSVVESQQEMTCRLLQKIENNADAQCSDWQLIPRYMLWFEFIFG